MKNRVHVVPTRDLAPHNTDSAVCACNPKVEYGIVIHNAFDHREIFEKYPNRKQRSKS